MKRRGLKKQKPQKTRDQMAKRKPMGGHWRKIPVVIDRMEAAAHAKRKKEETIPKKIIHRIPPRIVHIN